MIQAGEAPALGDRDEGRIPELYRKVAAITKPVRFTNYKDSFFRNENSDGLAEIKQWINRFD